jgi:hypothetical protein
MEHLLQINLSPALSSLEWSPSLLLTWAIGIGLGKIVKEPERGAK